ncbi:MAG: hypothetical protein ACE5EX_05340 [Phycisphaerae bacterium]
MQARRRLGGKLPPGVGQGAMLAISGAGAAAGYAQTPQHIVTVIRAPSELGCGWSALNNDGVAVGLAQFFGDAPFFLRACTWSALDGFAFLPPPPGQDEFRYGARDNSENGIISGDGEGDGAETWRFENGVYTIVARFPGDTLSTAGGVNDAGDVVGVSGHASFGLPQYPFLYTDAP